MQAVIRMNPTPLRNWDAMALPETSVARATAPSVATIQVTPKAM